MPPLVVVEPYRRLEIVADELGKLDALLYTFACKARQALRHDGRLYQVLALLLVKEREEPFHVRLSATRIESRLLHLRVSKPFIRGGGYCRVRLQKLD